MKKNLIGILLVCSVTVLIAEPEDSPEEVKYRPVKNAVYNVSISGFDERVPSPQILEIVKYSKDDKSFTVNTCSLNSRRDPTNDKDILFPIEFSPRGMKALTAQAKESQLIAGSFGRILSILTFPEVQTNLTIGSEWRYLLPPVAYEVASPYSIRSFSDSCPVTFKWKENTVVDGLKCAVIHYAITDEWQDATSGETYRFDCKGVCYFSIDVGIIVSDWVEATHDMKNSHGKKETSSVSRKTRLLGYQPYKE
jgi:hypothetical protein